MLTKTENQAARDTAADFQTAATAYKAFLASHNLPLSLDTHKLLDIYRGRLFEQLLAADTGLQARYEMARTKEGKQRIQADTMAGISLKGHELPEQLAEAMAELERAYHTLPQANGAPYLTLVQLIGYGLDYGRYLDQYTENWAGKEHAVAYFEQVAAVLTQWRTVATALRGNPHTLAHLLNSLNMFFDAGLPEDGPVQVDRKRLYYQLSANPQLLDVLTGPPASQAV